MIYGRRPWSALVCFDSAAALGSGGGDKGGDGDKGGGDKGGDGGNGSPWYSNIATPEVKQMMEAKNYASPEALANSYYNLRRLQTGAKDVVGIPAKDDDAEGWNKVHTALGRPAKVEDYNFKFGDDVKVHPKLETFAKDLFFKLGASPARAQLGVEGWNKVVKEINDEMAREAQTAAETEITKLKTTWGPKWDENIASGQQAVRALGIADSALQALDAAMGAPAVMQLMAEIGKKLGKELPIQGSGGGSGFVGMTKEMAQAEINRLMKDEAFQGPMRNSNHPERAANLAKWEQLHKIAHGGK